MAANRFSSPKVNWKAIIERFPSTEETQVNKLMKLKKNHEGFVRRLVSLPEKPPAIDWAAYKSKISPAFVDSIKQKYESIKIPYPKSNVDDIINAREKELDVDIAKTVAENNEEIKKLEAEIAALDARLPVEQMTWQEFKQAYPELGPSVSHPTPWPHDDPEVNAQWRAYLAAKEKGLKAERPSG
uniref:ATP synthase subunit d, mitochondrial n=1 Tax=Aceria tosichella TaxID=561515 RepID=A0A6G1S6F5_9ACAR